MADYELASIALGIEVLSVYGRQRARINQEADAREERVGAGYYPAELRERAARLATAWILIAADFDIDENDLANATSLSMGALDAAAGAARRRLRA